MLANQVGDMLADALLVIERVYNDSQSALQTVATVNSLVNLIQVKTCDQMLFLEHILFKSNNFI